MDFGDICLTQDLFGPIESHPLSLIIQIAIWLQQLNISLFGISLQVILEYESSLAIVKFAESPSCVQRVSLFQIRARFHSSH